MKIKTIILFIIALFIFPFVSANQGFNAIMYSGGSEICTCTSMQDEIIITNQHFSPIAYTISVSGKFKDFYTISEEFIILEPLQSFEIYGFFTPDCGFYGDGSISIKISSSTGNEKVIKKEISVLNCNNNLFTYRVANSFINEPCTKTIYPLNLKNIGLYPEIYQFSVEGIDSNYVFFSENSVFLQSGEEAEIQAYILMPCENFGELNGNFVSTAQKSNLVSKIPFKLDIKRNYNFSISFGYYDSEQIDNYIEELNYNFCAELMYQIPLKINNEVFISNSYNIDLKNHNWMKLDSDRVGIHGYNYYVLNITSKPKKENIGNHKIPIKVTSQRGSLSASAVLNITVLDCSSFDLEVDYNEDACCGLNSYKLKITNFAHVENNITLESNIYFNETNFLLEPREYIVLDFDVNLSCDYENEFFIKGSNFIENKEIKIPFNTYSTEQCQRIILDDRKSEIVFYNWKEIPLMFKNVGILYSNYKTSVIGPEWVTIDETNFSLGVLESRIINMYINPNYDIESGIYNFEIIHESSNGFLHVNYFEIELKHWNIIDATHLFIKNNKGITFLLFLILIVIILLLIFFIKDFKRKKPKKKKEVIKKEKKVVEKKIKEKKKKNKGWKIFGWILLILIILLLLFLVYNHYSDELIKPYDEKELSPEEKMYNYVIENNLTDSFFYHFWYENEIYSLDLNYHFEDTEGFDLNYSSSSADNIDIYFNNSIVNFIPNQNWTGVETIYFNVTNMNGETLTTPNVTLIVIKKREEYKLNETFMDSNLTDKNITLIELKNLTEEIRPEEEKYKYIVDKNLTGSFLYHVLSKNEVYTIDLDNNFEDPDGGILTYSSSFPENINVVIDGSIVYLTPKEDWTGVDKIFFRATDDVGDFVISPEVTLIVREKQEIEEKKNNLFQDLGLYTKLYLFYIVIGIVLLIIILISLRKKK